MSRGIQNAIRHYWMDTGAALPEAGRREAKRMGKEMFGKVTTRPAESFERDGKTFVRFFPVDGPPTEAEVFGPKEFMEEMGLTFAEFCDSLMAVPDDKADQVGKVR